MERVLEWVGGILGALSIVIVGLSVIVGYWVFSPPGKSVVEDDSENAAKWGRPKWGRPDERSPSPSKEYRRQAVALTGAVIINQDGKMMTYMKKCEKCGTMPPERTTSLIPTGTLSYSFTCLKCRAHQEIKIIGSQE
jgi:hypothetical protein